MTKFNLMAYCTAVARELRDHPLSYREGQSAFNVLHDMAPELAAEVRTTELDPFYDDQKLGEFYMWLEGKQI